MKPIVEECSTEEQLHWSEQLSIMIDQRNEYYPVLGAAIMYNESLEDQDGAKERAQEIRLFLDHYNPSELVPGRHFIITEEEAEYAFKILRGGNEKARVLSTNLCQALGMGASKLVGLHDKPETQHAYASVVYQPNGINSNIGTLLLTDA